VSIADNWVGRWSGRKILLTGSKKCEFEDDIGGTYDRESPYVGEIISHVDSWSAVGDLDSCSSAGGRLKAVGSCVVVNAT
jgi:hypothetical protein